MARPRKPEVDRAIHVAAVELLARVGYNAMTLDAVANRAGVARSTIYRRYANVADLIVAAVEDVLPMPADEDDDELAWNAIVRSLRTALVESDVGLSLLAGLVVASHEQPALLQVWRARVIHPRVARIGDVLGVAHEEAQLVGELAFGGLIARYLARGDISDADADEVAQFLGDAVNRG